MEIFFLLLRTLEEMPIVSDLIDDFGKVIESAVYVIPIISREQVSEGFLAVITVEITQSKINSVAKDAHIKDSTKWICYLDKRLFLAYDILREAGVPLDVFRTWTKERQPEDSFVSLFEKGLNKEERLIRWAKILFVFTKTGFAEDAVTDLGFFWMNMIENGDELIIRFPKEPENFDDDELSLNSSIFYMKQKVALWILNRRQSEVEKLEMLGQVFPFFEKNITFVKEESSALVQFSKFVFARNFASKNLQSLAIQIWAMREKVRFLETALKSPIWFGRSLSAASFDSYLIRRPIERDELDLFLQHSLKETLDNFISKTEEGLEFLVSESGRAGNARTEIFLRMQYVSFLLCFNTNTKYQSKINANLKQLRTFALNYPKTKENVHALEIEHYSQLKNYKRAAMQLCRMKAFEGYHVEPIMPSLLAKFPEKNLIIEEIDQRILSFTDFSLKSYEFTSRGLELKFGLEYFTEIDELKLTDIRLSVSTSNADFPILFSETLSSVLLKKSSGSFEVNLLFDAKSQGSINFLIMKSIEFCFCEVLFKLTEFPTLQNKNIDLDQLPCLFVNSSGFLNRLGPELIFFEENGPNYYFIQFSIFDNLNAVIPNLSVVLQKSSKYLIISEKVQLFNGEKCFELQCEFEKIVFPALPVGSYVMLLTLYAMHSKMKNFKLKLNCVSRGKPIGHVLTLKSKNESLYYLENHIQYICEEYSQLRVCNRNEGTINVLQINSKSFAPVRSLGTNEELSLIVSNKEETKIKYQLTDKSFQPQPIHKVLQKYVPDLIKTAPEVSGSILRIEQFILNRDLKIQSIEIKNKRDVKVFDQNHFVLHFTFNGVRSRRESKDSGVKKLYLELKWTKESYCVIGKHRFLLECNDKERKKEIAFIPFESGFLAYPQLLLVETKADGSEVQHLLNENKHLKVFFVHENIIKTAQFSSRAIRNY